MFSMGCSYNNNNLRKNKVRLLDACVEVRSHLFLDANSSSIDAEEKNMHRTRDEIRLDCTNQLSGINFHTKLRGHIKHMQSRPPMEDHRTFLIKDKRIKEKYVELLNEYNALSRKLMTITTRLSLLAHGPPKHLIQKNFEL